MGDSDYAQDYTIQTNQKVGDAWTMRTANGASGGQQNHTHGSKRSLCANLYVALG